MLAKGRRWGTAQKLGWLQMIEAACLSSDARWCQWPGVHTQGASKRPYLPTYLPTDLPTLGSYPPGQASRTARPSQCSLASSWRTAGLTRHDACQLLPRRLPRQWAKLLRRWLGTDLHRNSSRFACAVRTRCRACRERRTETDGEACVAASGVAGYVDGMYLPAWSPGSCSLLATHPATIQVVTLASPSSAIHEPIRGCPKATSTCKTRSGAASVCLVIQQSPANRSGRLAPPPPRSCEDAPAISTDSAEVILVAPHRRPSQSSVPLSAAVCQHHASSEQGSAEVRSVRRHPLASNNP